MHFIASQYKAVANQMSRPKVKMLFEFFFLPRSILPLDEFFMEKGPDVTICSTSSNLLSFTTNSGLLPREIHFVDLQVWYSLVCFRLILGTVSAKSSRVTSVLAATCIHLLTCDRPRFWIHRIPMPHEPLPEWPAWILVSTETSVLFTWCLGKFTVHHTYRLKHCEKASCCSLEEKTFHSHFLLM